MTEAQMAGYTRIREHAKGIVDELVGLLGKTADTGPIGYNRSLAIQKLEECMHRINDAMHFLEQSSDDSIEQKVAEAMGKPQMQLIKGGG